MLTFLSLINIDNLNMEKTEEEHKADHIAENWESIGHLDQNQDEDYYNTLLKESNDKGNMLINNKENFDYYRNVPPKSVVDLFILLFSLFDEKIDSNWDKTKSYREYVRILKNYRIQQIPYIIDKITYKQMKKVAAFFKKNPTFESMKAESDIVHAFYHYLRGIFNYWLYRGLYGRETRLKKYPGWEGLIFIKTEDECTGDNFKNLMEETYALATKYTGGEILEGLMIFCDYFDHENFLYGDISNIISVLTLLISKVSDEDSKCFSGFSGFTINSKYWTDLIINLLNFWQRFLMQIFKCYYSAIPIFIELN